MKSLIAREARERERERGRERERERQSDRATEREREDVLLARTPPTGSPGHPGCYQPVLPPARKKGVCAKAPPPQKKKKKKKQKKEIRRCHFKELHQKPSKERCKNGCFCLHGIRLSDPTPHPPPPSALVTLEKKSLKPYKNPKLPKLQSPKLHRSLGPSNPELKTILRTQAHPATLNPQEALSPKPPQNGGHGLPNVSFLLELLLR